MKRIEVLVACMEDESPAMLLGSIPASAPVRHTVVRGTRPVSTPRILNRAMREIRAERGEPWLWMLVHPDIELPRDFFDKLSAGVAAVEQADPKYGALGVMGVRMEGREKQCFGHLWDRNYEAGVPLPAPVAIEALDELCVFLRGGRDWTLEEHYLGTYHLWAAELCRREAAHGRKSYVVPGLYLSHHSTAPAVIPADPFFYFNLGVLYERYGMPGKIFTTPSGTVFDTGDDAGVRIA